MSGQLKSESGVVRRISSLAARPTAAEFGIGSGLIIDPTKPGYRIECTSDGVSWVSHGYSDSIVDRPSAAALGNGSWQVGADLYISDGVNFSGLLAGIGAVSRPYVKAQTAIPLVRPPSSTIGNNGALQLGTKVGGGTVTFGATSGAGVSATLSLAGFAGTSADVGKVITVDGGKQFTITAFGTTTTATGTLGSTLSGTGPFTDWTLAIPFLTTYSAAYLYFPANALYAGSVAKWYYTVMSSTTVGTVYDDSYLDGATITLPTVPTAIVAAGPGEFAQSASFVTGLNFTLTGGEIGANGALSIYIDKTNSAGAAAKFSYVYFDLSIMHFTSNTTNTISGNKAYISNRGVENSQLITNRAFTSEQAGTTVNGRYANVDTSVDVTFKSVVKCDATDWIVIEGLQVSITKAA